MMRVAYILAAGMIVGSSFGTATAGAAAFRGELGLDGQVFLRPARDSQQSATNLSLRLTPEFYHDWDDGGQRLAATLFARLDARDEARTHADVRELFWRRTYGGSLDVYVGARSVFWGVTETVHLVDIINQTDLVENVDGEDKLGQPMIAFSWQTGPGTLDAFVMPLFRERTYPGAGGRPRVPLTIDVGHPAYEASAGKKHVDLAVRYSGYIGDFDLGAAFFTGTSRAPVLVPVPSATGGMLLRPHYELLDQLGLDLQYTRGDWAWKLESVNRRQSRQNSTAFVAGFEYTLVGIGGGTGDLGLILEYQYDDQDVAVLSDNDIAIGGRLSFNDVSNTSLLAYTAIDVDNGSTITSIEGSRRLGNDWGLEVEARLFASNDARDPFRWLSDESYVQVGMTRFF